MAGGERSEGQGRPAYDKTLSVPRSGSIGMVLLVAVVLIGAAAGAATGAVAAKATANYESCLPVGGQMRMTLASALVL